MCRRFRFGLATVMVLWMVTGMVPGRAQELPTAVEIPPNATALEGLPHVRVETTRDGSRRRELDAAEAAKSSLSIAIVDGRFYRAGREGPPLTLTTKREFTYLSSTEPGTYVKIRRLNDRLLYVEHLDMPFLSVTYWGELRVVLKK
jgi:hypothetical protein